MLVKRQYHDGRVFTGQIVGKQKHGHGIMVWSAEPGDQFVSYYSGDWIQDKMSGYGQRRFPNGDAYVGQFIEDEIHGLGKMVFKAQPGDQNENHYIGEWVSGRKTGLGKYQFPNGDVYEGLFKDDMFFGRGKMVYKTLSGDQREQYFDDEFLNNMLTGHGHSTGEFQMAQIKSSKPHRFKKTVIKAKQDDESEYYFCGRLNRVKRTRNGRLPRATKTFNEDLFVVDELVKDEQSEHFTNH